MEILQKDFDIDTNRDGEALYLRLSGEFDLTGVEAFKDEMDLVKQSEPQELILDLQRLEFMDSTGIRMILTAQAQCESWNGRFSLIAGPPNVMRILQISGVESRLNIVWPGQSLLSVEEGR